MAQMNSFTKQKQMCRYQKQTYGFQRGNTGGGINQKFGINIHTKQYTRQIINKDLVYSTGNSMFCDNLCEKRI